MHGARIFMLTIAGSAHRVKLVMGTLKHNPIASWGHRTPVEGCLRGHDRGIARRMDRGSRLGFGPGSIGPSTYAQTLEVKANARLGWQPM